MAENNGNDDWRERMNRLDASVERNWEDHARMDHNLETLRTSMLQQKESVDKLLGAAIRDLIERIPPQSLHRN